MEKNKIYQGNAIDVLKNFEDNSIDCCVTSPPYYALRDYGTGTWVGGKPDCPHYRTSKSSDKTITGHKRMQENKSPVGDAIYKDVCPLCGAIRVDNQIGLEETPEKYIERLTEVFMEVHRVLKPEGTLWLNIGDSYNGSGGNHKEGQKNDTGFQGVTGARCGGKGAKEKWLKSKDLIGIPWMLAFSLRDSGWYLRQDIIWHKPNPMPESVNDRCTKSHEYIFLLSKSQRYYFDYEAIQEDSVCMNDPRKGLGHIDYNGKRDGKIGEGQRAFISITDKRNKRDVWSVNVKPCKEAHFATYPQELIAPCIIAGCPQKGVVLDPFIGSGTTAIVASKLGRDYVGIELNPEYKEMAERRIKLQKSNLTLF